MTDSTAAVPSQARAVVRDGNGRFTPGSGRPPGRKRGAGNVNAVRFPWPSLWRHGKVPKEFSWVGRVVAGYDREMAAHLGGEPSFAQQRLVEIARTAAGCSARIMSVATRTPFAKDPKTGGPDVSAALKELPRSLTLEALRRLLHGRSCGPLLTSSDTPAAHTARSRCLALHAASAAMCGQRRSPTAPTPWRCWRGQSKLPPGTGDGRFQRDAQGFIQDARCRQLRNWCDWAIPDRMDRLIADRNGDTLEECQPGFLLLASLPPVGSPPDWMNDDATHLPSYSRFAARAALYAASTVPQRR